MPESAIHQKIPPDIMKLLSFPMNDYLNKNQQKHSLKKWIEMSSRRWDICNSMIANFLDGMLVIPLLLAMKESNLLSNAENHKTPLFSELNFAVRQEIIEFFFNQGWLSSKEGNAIFTNIGRFIAERIFITTVVASYRPMLIKISEVIFGDCKSVFERDLYDNELHIDRTLNVIGSGFQHEKYFSDIEEIILSIFNRKPYEQQPKYIADMGCGDGTLLKKIYEIIKNKSIRGKVLNEYPIKLIGIDLSDRALEETARKLKDIDHQVLKGDIGDPHQMILDLKKNGIRDTENILHVRSFLDHDRTYIPPLDTSAEHGRSKIPCEAVYVDREGNEIPATTVIQSLVEHLKRWSSVIGRHGLIILEVHCLEPKTVSKFLDKCENLHFDTFHGFSQQLLVEANSFLMAAGEAGLFLDHRFSRKYPKTLPFSRITLNYFERRDYRIRYAQVQDLPNLEKLEKQCWEPGLRTDNSVLKKRLKQYPQGQLVLELDNMIAGAIYSQRIESMEELKTVSMMTVDKLHRRTGAIIQFLSLNILPEMQDRNYGDHLLEFMLQQCQFMNMIQKVVGITRCKDYYKHDSRTLQEYIRLRNKNGRLIDTILRFHELHGAQVRELVPQYRPKDKKNKGYGVLVEYDIYNRQRNDIQMTTRDLQKSVTDSSIEKSQSINHFIVKTITTILGKQKEDGFSLN
ncbi:MAG: polyketide synthase, partial [bacterium]